MKERTIYFSQERADVFAVHRQIPHWDHDRPPHLLFIYHQMLRAGALQRQGEVVIQHRTQSEKTLPEERAGCINRKGKAGRERQSAFPQVIHQVLDRARNRALASWAPPSHSTPGLHVVTPQTSLSWRHTASDTGASGEGSSRNLTGAAPILFSGTASSAERMGPEGITQQWQYFNILHSNLVVCPFPDRI